MRYDFGIIGAMGEMSGKEFGFPLVAKLATLRHHKTYHIPWHRHDMLELQYVLSGALTYEFKKSPPITIPGGCFFIVPSGVEHRAADDVGTPSVRLGLLFNSLSSSSATRTPFSTKELSAVFARFTAKATQPRRQTADGTRAAHALFKIVESGIVANPARLRHLVNAMLVETDAALDLPDRVANVSVGDMKSWIEEHCAEPLRIDDIVKMSGYSRTRLFALFASAVGMSPNDWLVRCRIEKAKRMLAIGKVSITDIASFCGFSSPAYFATTFRKYTGKSPRELMAKASKVIL